MHNIFVIHWINILNQSYINIQMWRCSRYHRAPLPRNPARLPRPGPRGEKPTELMGGIRGPRLSHMPRGEPLNPARARKPGEPRQMGALWRKLCCRDSNCGGPLGGSNGSSKSSSCCFIIASSSSESCLGGSQTEFASICWISSGSQSLPVVSFVKSISSGCDFSGGSRAFALGSPNFGATSGRFAAPRPRRLFGEVHCFWLFWWSSWNRPRPRPPRPRLGRSFHWYESRSLLQIILFCCTSTRTGYLF